MLVEGTAVHVALLSSFIHPRDVYGVANKWQLL